MSHMSEGDWGVPVWLFGLCFGTLTAHRVQRALGNVRPLIRRPVVLLSFLTAFTLSGVLFLVWQFKLGYAD